MGIGCEPGAGRHVAEGCGISRRLRLQAERAHQHGREFGPADGLLRRKITGAGAVQDELACQQLNLGLGPVAGEVAEADRMQRNGYNAPGHTALNGNLRYAAGRLKQGRHIPEGTSLCVVQQRCCAVCTDRFVHGQRPLCVSSAEAADRHGGCAAAAEYAQGEACRHTLHRKGLLACVGKQLLKRCAAKRSQRKFQRAVRKAGRLKHPFRAVQRKAVRRRAARDHEHGAGHCRSRAPQGGCTEARRAAGTGSDRDLALACGSSSAQAGVTVRRSSASSCAAAGASGAAGAAGLRIVRLQHSQVIHL
ncbi:hypothetical protein D3C75_407260 [compost metagenome]